MASTRKNCPCHSGERYEHCCKPYHEGDTLPENALSLMRSRYSAYALKLPAYIIETTHPGSPFFQHDCQKWEQDILKFCKTTKFVGLKIHDFSENRSEAFVTFTAFLSQKGENASFVEKSRFEKKKGRWLYRDAIEWRSADLQKSGNED